MSVDARTYMPIYIGSYQKNTTRLSTEQHGAYFLMLMDYWVNGPLPDDDAVLARITKLDAAAWAAMRPVLAGYFRIAGGLWRQARADTEIERAQAMVRRAAKAGRASGAARKREKVVENGAKNPDSRTLDLPGISNGSEQAFVSSWPPSTNPLPSPSESKEDSGAKAPASNRVSDKVAPHEHPYGRYPPPKAEPPRLAPLDLKAIVFGEALRWLCSRLPGKAENGLRGWLGKLVRDYGEAWLLEALRRAQRESAVEPISFVEACLRKMKQQGAPGHRPEHASSSAIAGRPEEP